MAFLKINNVRIAGLAGAVPDNLVNSHDFDFFSHEDAENFIKTVGIENRYIAPDNICASDLCYEAAERLISDLGWKREEIEILAFESVTRDFRTPPTSCLLQERLKLPSGCFTLDIPMGCCGFMYALTVVGNMMASGYLKKALLLVGDTATRMGSPKDKSRVPLFGDCGTAIALEYNKNAHVINTEFNSFGEGFSALMTPHGEFRHPATPESFEYHDFGNGVVRAPVHSLINGMDVFSFAITKPPKSIEQFLQLCNIDKDKDVDYFLIHQANKMIVDRIVKKLKIDVSKVPGNLKEYGNLGGASIPMLMITNLQKELQEKELFLVLSSFGLGLTWGTMSLKVGKISISEIIKV
jgi:3-oxoacyl-[acyl-carrier-protein] synthase III